MNPLVNENIFFTDDNFHRLPVKTSSNNPELIAFCISVVFLVLLTAIITFAFSIPQNDHPRKSDGAITLQKIPDNKF